MGQRKKVNLETIARELNISIASVSYALNEKKGVSEELRERVKQKAEELGFRPLHPPEDEKKLNQIGVMIAERYVKELPSPHMDIYRHLILSTAKVDCLTALAVISEDMEELRSDSYFFTDMDIDGIVIIGKMNMDFIRRVKERAKVPVTGLDIYQ